MSHDCLTVVVNLYFRDSTRHWSNSSSDAEVVMGELEERLAQDRELLVEATSFFRMALLYRKQNWQQSKEKRGRGSQMPTCHCKFDQSAIVIADIDFYCQCLKVIWFHILKGIFRHDDQGNKTLVYDETTIVEAMRATTISEALLDVYEVFCLFCILRKVVT